MIDRGMTLVHGTISLYRSSRPDNPFTDDAKQ